MDDLEFENFLVALDTVYKLVPDLKAGELKGAVKVILAQQWAEQKDSVAKGRPKKINAAAICRKALLISTINEIKEKKGYVTDSEACSEWARRVKAQGIMKYRGANITGEKIVRDLQNAKRDGVGKELEVIYQEHLSENPNYAWEDMASSFERILPYAESLDEKYEDHLKKRRS